MAREVWVLPRVPRMPGTVAPSPRTRLQSLRVAKLEQFGEPPACGDADGIDRGTQMVITIGPDGQLFAIRELEARDVDRQTGCMRADLAGLCAVAVAAFITRSGVKHRWAGNQSGQRLYLLDLPHL
jgi:hypothetical protein